MVDGAACESAAATLGKDFRSVGAWAAEPKGCITRPTGATWFNTHATGRAHPSDQPLCITQACATASGIGGASGGVTGVNNQAQSRSVLISFTLPLDGFDERGFLFRSEQHANTKNSAFRKPRDWFVNR